ncbi:hypothetical protein [Streptomyces sp. NPDC005438]|uniref:hypothetical protein n=1 Tax=Streptomyces sp. NPDC005438 TaxID=3156880 RepID=UPI00339FDD11
MAEFFAATLDFPAVLFTFALVVVIAYWLIVIFGGISFDELSESSDAGSGAALATALGLRGVPLSVVLSLLILFSWFLSLAGKALLPKVTWLDGRVEDYRDWALLGCALVGAWILTWALATPLRRAFPDEVPPSRLDFVGQVCVIRTGRVDDRFGQAEVTSQDGSSAIVQVRTDETGLTAGSSALIFDYDPEGEFFRVGAFEIPPDMGLPRV